MKRLVIVPDERLLTGATLLKGHLPAIAREIDAENLVELISDPMQRAVISMAGGKGPEEELLIWGKAERAYQVAWTSMAPAEEVTCSASADLGQGLVSQVFDSAQSYAQAHEELQADSWTNLEQKRGTTIRSMAASPVLLFGHCAAAVTLIRYSDKKLGGDLQEPLTQLIAASTLLGRLLEDRLIRATLGLEAQ